MSRAPRPSHRNSATRVDAAVSADRDREAGPLVGGLVFLFGFVGIIVAGQLTAVPLPLPGSDAELVSTYFREQTLAVVANSVLQGVSALGLGVFVAAVVRRLSSWGRSARVRLCRLVGTVAVISLALSALTTLALAVMASRVGAGTVAALQQVGFVLGGVVHVVSLGVLVWCLGRAGTWSTSVQRFGWVAAVPAVLSLLSVVVFPASVLLPLGRVLCMVWAIAAGVSLWRGRGLPARSPV